MIETRELTKRFDDNLAVDQLDLSVKEGEVFGFLGPNGAGKTTTIRMLSALISPSSGKSWVAGFEVGREDDEIRRRVGILTESPGLYDRLSAERNLEFFAQLYEVENLAEQVERYLRMLGLWERRKEAAGTFSKGMRQKLVIARALLHEPEVLLLDEPTSGLDPEAAKMIRDFIGTLKKEGRTIFLCTHNLAEADQLCDRIAIFSTQILALDTPAALRRQLYGRSIVIHLAHEGSQYVSVIEQFPFVQEVRAMENKMVVKIDEPEVQNPLLVRSLVEAGAEIQFVGELRRSLEDVYLHLVQDDKAKG